MKVLPLYLPHQGCAHQCVYCNQPLVVGKPSEKPEWEHRLNSLGCQSSAQEWEIAFFAGTFSALPMEEMDQCFDQVTPYLNQPNVLGVRISTRPDKVDDHTLAYLKERGVRTIELGIESFDDRVLQKSGRGHSAETGRQACERVKHWGFELGMHLMCGLPTQSFESWRQTVEETLKIQPAFVRIAPTLVLKGTPLERLYERGAYLPMEFHEALEQCAFAYRQCHRHGIAIARVGLALSDDSGDGANKVIAGPWHPSLRHEVEAYLAGKTILFFLQQNYAGSITIHPHDISIVQGTKRGNVKMWEDTLNQEIEIKKDTTQPRKTFSCQNSVNYSLFQVDNDH